MKTLYFCGVAFFMTTLFGGAISRNVNEVSTNVEVIIVGAGASGYAAGTRLLENGFNNFIILEAQDRIGGRLHTVPFGSGTIDMGGQWLHGKEGNVVYHLADQLNLVYTEPQYTSKIHRSDGKEYDTDFCEKLFEIYSEILDENLPKSPGNISQGAYFIERYWPKVNPIIEKGNLTKAEAQDLLRLLELMLNSNDASPNWLETALTQSSQYAPIPNEDNANAWKIGGYSNLFKILSKKIPNPKNELPIADKILLNKSVTKVDYSGARVVVSTADGSQYTADRVLVTASLNVLKATASDIFTPALPPLKTKAIQNIGMGSVDKIYLEFPYRWWDLGTTGMLTVWTAEDLAKVPKELEWVTGVFALSGVAEHPHNLLCGWITGRHAEAMEALPEEVVKEELMKVIRRFAGPKRVVPDPVSVRRSTWFSNPYTRGSYSFRMLTSDAQDVWAKDLAQPVTNADGSEVILFAGEATSDRWWSTVNGAVETGWREADRIISLKSN